MIGNRTSRIFIQPDVNSGKLNVRYSAEKSVIADNFSGEFEGVSKFVPKNSQNEFYRFNFRDGDENYTLSLPARGAQDIIRALLSIQDFAGVNVRIDARGKTVQTRFGVKNIVNLYVSVNGDWIKWAVPAPEEGSEAAWFERNMSILNSRCAQRPAEGDPQATVAPEEDERDSFTPPASEQEAGDDNFFNEGGVEM